MANALNISQAILDRLFLPRRCTVLQHGVLLAASLALMSCGDHGANNTSATANTTASNSAGDGSGDGVESADASEPLATADEAQEKENLLKRCVGIFVTYQNSSGYYQNDSRVAEATLEQFVGILGEGAWEYGHGTDSWIYRFAGRDELTGRTSEFALQFKLEEVGALRYGKQSDRCGPGSAILKAIAKDGIPEAPEQISMDFGSLVRRIPGIR